MSQYCPMDVGPSTPSGTGKSEYLGSLDAQKLGECTKVAMGSVALVPLSMRGTANTPAESREKTAISKGVCLVAS